ncbi:flagellar basal body-associated FliL family protein [Sphingomonas montana]|uniref:flagellar basal body-associated FliL family protein n=1 Tax=Sphingomonas montana TaxID=1843236 RepID=UPI00096DEE1A|nr:flagellar basal body-associated FliL family protein [Sphingomonas montana]
MSDDKTDAPVKKGAGRKKLILIGLGAVLLGGGGVGAGIWAGGGKAAEHETVDRPKLVVRDGLHADEDAGGPKGTGGIDRLKYKVSYAPIEQPFTSNLLDSDSVVQMALGVSTYYDERVLEAVKTDDTPIRSEILMLLADQDPETIATPQGKKALQKALKKTINDVLIDKEGFGGVDDVYFTSFIIQ